MVSLLSTNQNVGLFLPAVNTGAPIAMDGKPTWCPSIVFAGGRFITYLKDTPARTTTGAHNSHKRQTVDSKLIWRCVT